MDSGTDWGNGITHHLLYAEYAQQGDWGKLTVDFIDIGIGPEILLYKKAPEPGGHILGDVVEFQLQLVGDGTALHIYYSQVKQRVADAELAQVNKVLAALLIKNHVAYVKVTVQGCVAIGKGIDETDYAAPLLIGQVWVLQYVLLALVLYAGEQSGWGCSGVEFLADSGKLCGILLHIFRVDAQRACIGELAVNAFELYAYTIIGGVYHLAGLGAGQSQIIYFTGPFILIEPHLLQICGVEFEQHIRVILFNITLTKLSASGELIVL